MSVLDAFYNEIKRFIPFELLLVPFRLRFSICFDVVDELDVVC